MRACAFVLAMILVVEFESDTAQCQIEKSKHRVTKFKKEQSKITIPAELDLEKVNVDWEFFGDPKETIPSFSWTGDALLELRARIKVSGRWKKVPADGKKRRIKLHLVADLESYCSVRLFMARAKKLGIEIPPKDFDRARNVLDSIGDKHCRTFDTYVFDLEIELPRKIPESGYKTDLLELQLPYSFQEKKQSTVYRVKLRSSKIENQLESVDRAYMYTWRMTDKEIHAHYLEYLVRLASRWGWIDPQTRTTMLWELGKWYRPSWRRRSRPAILY